MLISERASALVAKIDAVSKQPLAVRALHAERLVREAASLLLELSLESERVNRDASLLRGRLEKLERMAAPAGG